MFFCLKAGGVPRVHYIKPRSQYGLKESIGHANLAKTYVLESFKRVSRSNGVLQKICEELRNYQLALNSITEEKRVQVGRSG